MALVKFSFEMIKAALKLNYQQPRINSYYFCNSCQLNTRSIYSPFDYLILILNAFPYFKNVATCLKQDYTIPSKINRATIEALMSVWLSKDLKICFYSKFFIHEYFVSFFAIRWNDFYELCRAFTQYRPIYIQIKPVFCASTLQMDFCYM